VQIQSWEEPGESGELSRSGYQAGEWQTVLTLGGLQLFWTCQGGGGALTEALLQTLSPSDVFKAKSDVVSFRHLQKRHQQAAAGNQSSMKGSARSTSAGATLPPPKPPLIEDSASPHRKTVTLLGVKPKSFLVNELQGGSWRSDPYTC
jgi:hypothetical protein